MDTADNQSNVIPFRAARTCVQNDPPAKPERDAEKVSALLLAGIIMTLKPKHRRKLRKILLIGLEARPKDVNVKAAIDILG